MSVPFPKPHTWDHQGKMRLIICGMALVVVMSSVICEDQIQATTPADDSQEREQIAKEIEKMLLATKAVLFSKTYCPYSKRVKLILEPYRIKDIHVEEVNLRNDSLKVQDELEKYSHIHTVPQFFLNGKFVGNFDRINKLESDGKLRQILEDAGAIPKKH
ncbi:unnamed protein product [Bursaphelenchus xylophilus]|uniref:(pine wood nematode) hypothetical protein n=1 Tax=Bursaphelenchus xylophilus TaxID=6326 RepID=A0A1I7RZA5_BURXY|nr:unnamed protein product [Bursaphelenchus xylophilus]CAG9106677.1 unnamed protein product [Bursaphelenchus xylophilus]